MDAAITSKPAPAQATGEPVNNSLKAIKEERDGGTVEEPPQQAGRGPLASQGEEDERVASGSENASRGSFESVGPRRSRTASVSSSQRGSRMSAFGWIAGKIGLSETREEAEAGEEPEDVLRSEENAVEAAPEVPYRSPEPHGATNASEIAVHEQEPTSEAFVPEVGEKDAATDREDTHSADLSSLESVTYNGAPQVTTISPNQAFDNEASSPLGESGSQGLGSAQHEMEDPSPGGHRFSQEVEVIPGNTISTHAPTDGTLDEPEFEYDQSRESNVSHNDETNGAVFFNDQATASSRAASPVETAPGLDGSETTLEVDSEPYQEEVFARKTQDEHGAGDFEPEHDADDVLYGEVEGTRGMGPHLTEDGSQMPAVPTETEDTNAEGDTPSPGFDQGQQSPPPHTHDNDSPVFEVDPDDVQYGSDVDVAPRSVPAPRELEEIEDAQSIPSAPAVTEEEPLSPAPEPLVYEPTEQSDEFDHGASEVVPFEQDHEDNFTAPDNGGMQEVEEASTSQYQAAEEVSDTTLEPATGNSPQSVEPEEDFEEDGTFDKYPPIELPLHAMDYSLGPDGVQLPNGTWPAGAVDEDLLESLIAQFLVPSLINSEPSSLPDDSTLPLSPGQEELSSPPLEGQSDTVTPHDDERNYDDEITTFSYPSFAHEVQPMAVQLATGVWSIDPTFGEFEDALASQNAAASDTYARTLNSPEEKFEIASAQTQQISTPADYVTPTTDALASPAADLDHDSTSEVVQSSSHAELGSSPIEFNPEETVQEADEEQTRSGQASEVGDRSGTVSMEEANIPSEQVISDNQGEHLDYGASQAASREEANLPWSPFNSRIPLSPEASPATPIQSPQLAEDYEGTLDEDADAANTTARHSTFGYGSNQAVPEVADYQIHDMPGNPYAHADMLNVTETATDSDSQNFVTPLQSAGMQSPQAFEDPADTFHNAVDYSHSEAPHEEAATTVHGQDELFDSDSMSEYEPDPSVDENGDPRANLGMPPQHHAFVNGYAEEASDSPNTAILQPAAENSYYQTPEMPPAVEDNSDVSPMSLRHSSPPSIPPRKGLAFSRHNPERPVTPPAQTIPEDLGSHQGRWDASGPIDSTPMSLVSHSTLSSSPDSPVRERMHEGREPAIQSSWSEGIHAGQHDYEREYEATPVEDAKFDENLPTPIATHMPESVRDSSPATPSPSTLIQKMRGIFENPSMSSPVRSRPSSGIYNTPRPFESPGYDVPGEPRKGGFLNEAEDDIDERSALLGSVGRN